MRHRFIILAAVFACVPMLTFAQAPKEAPSNLKSAAPVPVASIPERTTASFGDWVMRCENTGTPAKRVCEAAQIMTVQGQSNPIAQIAVGKSAATNTKQITLVLPANVAFASKPQITLAKTGASPTDLAWQRCTPGGCFASATMTDSVLSTFGAETEPGRISFKDAADRDTALPLSFRGLAQALESLAKEP